MRLVHLSAGNGESALPESTGPTGKRSAPKDARSVWKGGKTVKSYLSLPKKVAKEVGLDLRGAYLNLDGGFDSTYNRKCIFNAGMIPDIKENPRNRKHTKRGRKRFFNAAIHALRARVERTFAWEDKFKRLLLRFEHMQHRHFGMKLLAYTLINVREFCGA